MASNGKYCKRELGPNSRCTEGVKIGKEVTLFQSYQIPNDYNREKTEIFLSFGSVKLLRHNL